MIFLIILKVRLCYYDNQMNIIIMVLNLYNEIFKFFYNRLMKRETKDENNLLEGKCCKILFSWFNTSKRNIKWLCFKINLV